MKKRKWHVIITAALITSTTMQSFAAGWQQNSDLNWQWEYDDGTKQNQCGFRTLMENGIILMKMPI